MRIGAHYYRRTDESLMAIYVDDCVIATKSKEIYAKIKADLGKHFELKETALTDFLGLSIIQTKDEITIHLQNYIDKCLDELNFKNVKEVETPVSTGTILEEGSHFDDNTLYQSVLGKLSWISRMRTDMNCITNMLCRQTQKPTSNSWNVLKRCFKYLKGTKQMVISIKKDKEGMGLNGFADASSGY